MSIEIVDGKPKVEWEPKVNHWTGAEIPAVLKGAAVLDGMWQMVTEEDKQTTSAIFWHMCNFSTYVLDSGVQCVV